MSKPLKYALFLGVLGLIVGALLALVNYITLPRIEEQEKAKITNTLNVYYESNDWEEIEFDSKNVNGAYALTVDTKNIYAYKSTGKGYKSGDIVIMTFIEDSVIKKVVLVSMSDQTSGIGTQVGEQSYLDKFVGINVSTYVGDSSNNHNSKSTDVLTGATYSSKGVIDAIIRACNEYNNNVNGTK